FITSTSFSYQKIWVLNPKPNNLDRRFRIYRETLSRFSLSPLRLKKWQTTSLIYVVLLAQQAIPNTSF
ncbi:hypothetical protein ACTMNS_12920, partial [Staphylococcus haemolyticus]